MDRAVTLRILRAYPLPTHHDGPASEKEAIAHINVTERDKTILRVMYENGASTNQDIAYDIWGEWKRHNEVSGRINGKGPQSLVSRGLAREVGRTRGRYGFSHVRTLTFEITAVGRELLGV